MYRSIFPTETEKLKDYRRFFSAIFQPETWLRMRLPASQGGSSVYCDQPGNTQGQLGKDHVPMTLCQVIGVKLALRSWGWFDWSA
jgi:hypothetical protein